MAASLNKVMLIGRLGQDPELKYLPSGDAVVNFSLATDESYRDRQSGEMVDRVEWHRVVVFGRQAEIVANYARKGRLVFVEGGLQTRKWQAQDGSDRYTTEIKAQRVNFLDSKGAEEGAGAPQQAPRQQQGGRPQGQGGRPQQPQQAARKQYDEEDLGPAFPSEAGGMDDVPF